MNLIKQAYIQGKNAAESAFKPVAAPTPKGPQLRQTQTAATPATQNNGMGASGKPAIKAPATMGLGANSIAGMSGSGGPPGSLASNSSAAIGAPALAQQGAVQLAQNTFNGAQNALLGPLAKLSWLQFDQLSSAEKRADFNFGMTPDRSKQPDKIPKGDNGQRWYGNHFNDPTRPAPGISAAWNAMNNTRNHDVLNEMGQMEFGAPRG